MAGMLSYKAVTGTTGPVTVIVSSLKPGATTWTQIAKRTISATTPSYQFYVTDVNHRLNSGTVKYRVTTQMLPVDTKVTLPADVLVDYTKASSAVTSNKLAGKTLTTDSLYPFKAAGVLTGSTARAVYVQRYDATKKTWYSINYTQAYPSKTFNIALPQTKATETYRIYSPATLTHTAYTGPATVVKRTSPRGQFYSMQVQRKRIAPWATNTANVYVSSRLVQGEAAPSLSLQQIVGKQWKTVTTVKKQGRITFTLPKGNTNSSNTTKVYRYVVNSSRFADSAVSPSFSVQWENPRKYTGTKRTAYNYASRYCPNMLIDVKQLGPGIAGLAHLGTDVTSLSSTAIEAHDLRTVSLHECAHHRQWSLYHSSWSSFQTRMNNLYNSKGRMGIEYTADCIANIWYPNSYWGYARKCTGQQEKAARVMASGKRY
jgi:hypothetical protein